MKRNSIIIPSGDNLIQTAQTAPRAGGGITVEQATEQVGTAISGAVERAFESLGAELQKIKDQFIGQAAGTMSLGDRKVVARAVDAFEYGIRASSGLAQPEGTKKLFATAVEQMKGRMGGNQQAVADREELGMDQGGFAGEMPRGGR